MKKKPDGFTEGSAAGVDEEKKPEAPSSALPDIEKTVGEITALMERLRSERAQLLERLEQVDKILGIEKQSGPPPRPKNPYTLRELIAEILKDKPKGLSKLEILDAVQKEGYEFYGQRPLSSINVVLYTRRNGFRRAVQGSPTDEVRFLAPPGK